ncbi:hypothetical protein ACRAWD_13715 [Caulobacter segnis]
MKIASFAAALLVWAGSAQARPDSMIPVWTSPPTFRPATVKDGEALVYEGQSVRQDIRILLRRRRKLALRRDQ